MTAKLEKRQPTLDAEIEELRERRVTTQEKHSAAVIALTAARVKAGRGGDVDVIAERDRAHELADELATLDAALAACERDLASARVEANRGKLAGDLRDLGKILDEVEGLAERIDEQPLDGVAWLEMIALVTHGEARYRAGLLRANGQFRTLFPDVRRESSRFLSDRLQNCSLQIAGKTPPPKKQPAVVLLGLGLSRARLATLQAWLVDG